MRGFRVVLLFAVIVVNVIPAHAQHLTIYTEEFPPYNFTKSKVITGVSTEVVTQVMRSTGYSFTIKARPWAEAYNLAQEQPNTLIYSISRNKDREKLFKWIGVLTPTTYSALSLKSRRDIKINNLEDMKKYKIGTTTDDVVELWLIGKGFSKSDLFSASGDNAAMKNFKNLLNKNIDIWPFPDAVAYHIVRQEGHSKPELLLNKAFAIEELSGGYYIAASLSTPDAVVAGISRELKKYKQTDDYFKVLAHWGVDAAGLKTTAPISKLIYSLKYFTSISKIGYLAGDKLSAHREGGLYRKEMREEFVENYVKTFDEWREKYINMQDQVDIIIIGTVKNIRGWNASEAKRVVLNKSRIPTGSVLNGLADYALIGYEDDAMVINELVAKQLGIKFPKSYLSRAARIVE